MVPCGGSRGFGVFEDLLESVPVDVVIAAGGAFAQAVDEDAAADLGPGHHVCVHPSTSRLRDRDEVKGTSIVIPAP